MGVGSPNTRCVKTSEGVVEDWVRDLICVLVGKHGAPASRVYDLVRSVAEALGIEIVGKWSARTAGRAVGEGGIAAEQMIVSSVRDCMGMLWLADNLRKLTPIYCSDHVQWRRHRVREHIT